MTTVSPTQFPTRSPTQSPTDGGVTNLTLDNNTVPVNAIQTALVGEFTMRVEGDIVSHTDVLNDTLVGPITVLLDSLTAQPNLPPGQVIANITNIGGTAPFVYTEVPPLSDALAVVGSQLLSTRPFLNDEEFEVSIGVTDINDLSYIFTQPFTITVDVVLTRLSEDDVIRLAEDDTVRLPEDG